MSDRGEPLDEAFARFGANVVAYADLVGEVGDPEAGFRLQLEELSFETPIELDLRIDDHGHVTIGCVPPLYRVDTTIQPVFHQLGMRVVPLRDSHGSSGE